MAIASKDKELAAVGISIAAGCKPCTDFHIKAARKTKASHEEIRRAIDDGVALRHAAAELMEAYGLSQLRAGHEDGEAGKVNSGERARILTLIGAAIAVSCVASLQFYLREARRIGVRDDDIQTITELAHLIKQKAASHVDHLLTSSETPAA